MLHTEDAVDAIRTTQDLLQAGHGLTYQRLQDGPAFGLDAVVAAFAPAGNGRARCLAVRRLLARRPGSAPGDIVYDPDFAHLLHTFIARASDPTFYDASDVEGGDALATAIVAWPAGPDVCRADDPGLVLIGPNEDQDTRE